MAAVSLYHVNSKDLDVSRQVKILKKTTTLLNLQNMFRQKLLSSSVDRFTKRSEVEFISRKIRREQPCLNQQLHHVNLKLSF